MQRLQNKFTKLHALRLTNEQAVLIVVVGEVLRRFFKKASPRHTLERRPLRQLIGIYVLLVYRKAGLSLNEYEFIPLFLFILRDTCREVSELEVLEIFPNAENVVQRIETRLAACFL